jgi:hypothetical protein
MNTEKGGRCEANFDHIFLPAHLFFVLFPLLWPLQMLFLLDLNHRSGKSKARFFAGYGYAGKRWQALAEALRAHAREKRSRQTSPDGDTIAVVTLMANQVRATRSGEIAHVRAMAAGWPHSHPPGSG